uniref:Fucosyltransferase n=1 Tax=Globodera pallida TaxID=36090 RepID=A0A183BZ80_GLOPA
MYLFYYLYVNYDVEIPLIYSEEAADSLNYFNNSSKAPIIIMWNNECIGDTMISLLDRGFPTYLPLTAQNKCPFKCEYTANRSLEQNSAMLVFHLHGNCLIDQWPKKRQPNQNYVMFTVEPPVYTLMYFNRSIMTDTFFNTTVTYQTDSTVFMPYDSLVKITADTPIEDRWTEEEIRQKISAFNFYLDLFGSCGGQKFWRSLRKLTVPVVLRRAVFSGIDIPPNAFIAADDFGTVKELAQYLISLQNDTERYLKHFEWTKTYRKSAYTYRFSPLCTLCQMLHKKMDISKKTIDLNKFWPEKECKKEFVQQFLLKKN